MSSDDWLDNEPPTTNSANLTTSSKSKSSRRPNVEAASGWSNDINDENGNLDISTILPSQPPMIRQSTRRAAEEIIATDIPTIPMDDADGDDTIDMTPQIAVAPEFSVHQIASFKEIEHEFSRERASQYIDSKIDIGILYHNLHLQEEFDAEEQKPWDWDKLFVEVRNSISNPITDS
ncbi:unnamed protein product [Rotaria sp. Silwood2]|nr:unnamed protein product [Rotaria sp. Silwood2]CAF2532181.1 unnamed protein product [Rotaria sp. Silwood2]CAF2758765.1 unnamed protein product [Rotaria sp. Silwood2]CAF2936690.1 unnamed protein product [Rotaria sp. Silwood2]CAF3848548.1 unnamed protein product [Rotaria sp. Silwood2]